MTFKRMPMMAGLLALGMTTTACPETDCQDADCLELRQLDAKLTAAEISTQYSALSQGVAESMLFLNDSSTVSGAMPEECTWDDATGQSVCTPAEIDVTEPSRESAEWLQAHLFNEEHLRGDLSTATGLLFCLKSDDTCAVENPEPGQPAIDADCVELLTQVPVCVRVSSVIEGSYDLQLLLGQQQEMNPADLHLSAQRIATELKLGAIKTAVEKVAQVQGGQLGEEWPKQLAGEIGLELLKKGEKAYDASVAVRQDVAVDLYDTTDARRTELRVSAAPNLFKVSVDGVGKVVKASADVAAIDLKAAAELLFGRTEEVCEPPADPYGEPVCHTEEEHYTGRFLAQLAGLSGAVELSVGAADAETITVRDIGLGNQTSKILFDKGAGAAEILAVDLNAALGRRLEMTVTKVGEKAQVSFAPGLALRVAHDLQALADQFEGISGWALKGVTEVELSGTQPAVLLDGGPNDSGVKVVAGALSLSASDMIGQSNVSLSAEANQCVWEPQVETYDEEAHPFSRLVVGACQ
jgi:hypothetical protein